MLLFLVFILALMSGLVVLFFTLGVGKVLSKSDHNAAMHQLLAGLSESEIALKAADADLPDKNTWYGYWYALALKSGEVPQSTSTPGLLAAGFGLGAFVIGVFIWPQDIFGGIAMAPLAMFFLKMIFESKSRARLILIEKQLPNLLSGLRANIRAELSPQQAIVNQSKELPAPLGTELKNVAKETELGIPLDTALKNFALRIPSKEVTFLVSAINTAIETGSDLDPLLRTIQNIVVQRQRIANHLRAAVAKVQPALGVTGIMIPAGFLYSFYSSETNRAFWVSFPLGIVAIFIVAFLYAVGLFIARKQVDRVKNA